LPGRSRSAEGAKLGILEEMTPGSSAALTILVLTYVGVAAGRIPGLRLDRAGIAFLGGAAMIALGPLSLEDAFRSIDFNTIALLLGMMIVVAHLNVSGAFRALGALVIEHAHAPFVLLVTITVLAGVLSAFLVNDAICLVMAPIVVQVIRALNRNPLPYLVATATASNCGSVATITGNPQNMVIGTLSGISYPAFSAALAPVAAFSLVAVVVVVRLVYRKEFRSDGELQPHLYRGHMHTGQVVKASLVCVALAVAFFAGVPPAKAAVLGGAFLLVTRAIKPRRIYREIDGPLLILFAGMFVVVAGAERALLTPDHIAMVKTLGLDIVWRLSVFTAVLSNVVSNVPAVLALRPFVPTFADPQRAWLTVAMSSTLAGNFTLIGSVANLIVAEQARAEGTPISFWAYFKVGAPLTVLTLAAGTAWLSVR
jgi:Na+/H+ antiporter NhaD/arsenite permease-like protein